MRKRQIVCRRQRCLNEKYSWRNAKTLNLFALSRTHPPETSGTHHSPVSNKIMQTESQKRDIIQKVNNWRTELVLQSTRAVSRTLLQLRTDIKCFQKIVKRPEQNGEHTKKAKQLMMQSFVANDNDRFGSGMKLLVYGYTRLQSSPTTGIVQTFNTFPPFLICRLSNDAFTLTLIHILAEINSMARLAIRDLKAKFILASSFILIFRRTLG